MHSPTENSHCSFALHCFTVRNSLSFLLSSLAVAHFLLCEAEHRAGNRSQVRQQGTPALTARAPWIASSLGGEYVAIECPFRSGPSPKRPCRHVAWLLLQHRTKQSNLGQNLALLLGSFARYRVRARTLAYSHRSHVLRPHAHGSAPPARLLHRPFPLSFTVMVCFAQTIAS